MSQEIEADILAGNSSQEVEVIEVNSDEEVEQNDDVFWQRANTTPVTKSCNNEVPVYVGIFMEFLLLFPVESCTFPMLFLCVLL